MSKNSGIPVPLHILQSHIFQTDSDSFKKKALYYANMNFSHVCFLEGNNLPYLHNSFPSVLAFGAKKILQIKSAANAFDQLEKFQSESEETIFGFLTYDLKNELENLESNNKDGLQFPAMLFFEPEHIIEYHLDKISMKGENAGLIFESIIATEIHDIIPSIEINSRIPREVYIDKIKSIQSHIDRGDVYELNFCQEFFAENAQIDPVGTFIKLNQISPMPFACFFKAENKYLVCASPERFLKKDGNTIISQPIKGTVRRGKNEEEDQQLVDTLLHSEKELAENVMIVDLVRNDLSKTAQDGSVKVEELFGIYSFSNVHQMISTVVSELDEKCNTIDTLKTTFPMGSMTGAPKISAMELIENYEETKRGLFSGAVGYISEEGNFDFNVVIRSILYDSESKYLSFQVGSAITSDAIPEKEWEECEVKISAIKKALQIS